MGSSQGILRRPKIVGIGGTGREGSGTEKALTKALLEAEREGADVQLLGGAALGGLPLFDPWSTEANSAQAAFLDAVRTADGLILASPAYHGSISGIIKNALDTLELTAKEPLPYFAEKPVGTIITAYGWQGCGTALVAMRTIVHALRGWPTPFGATINSAASAQAGETVVTRDDEALAIVARQVTHFAQKTLKAEVC